MLNSQYLISNQKVAGIGQAQWLTHVILALWGTKAGGSLEVRSLRPTWPTWWNPVSSKNTKISQAWWLAPVIPPTQEVEARKSLQPWRRRLQWADIVPLHSSLDDRVRLHLNNNNNGLKISKFAGNYKIHKSKKLNDPFFKGHQKKNHVKNIRMVVDFSSEIAFFF